MIELELRRVMPKRTRVYVMVATRDLFGALVLRVRFGRVGWRTLREREEAFTTEHALTTRVRALVTTRLHHGYTAHAGDVARYDARRKQTRMPKRSQLEAHLVTVDNLAALISTPPPDADNRDEAQHALASAIRAIIRSAAELRAATDLPPPEPNGGLEAVGIFQEVAKDAGLEAVGVFWVAAAQLASCEHARERRMLDVDAADPVPHGVAVCLDCGACTTQVPKRGATTFPAFVAAVISAYEDALAQRH